jgi:hypothetical protein
MDVPGKRHDDVFAALKPSEAEFHARLQLPPGATIISKGIGEAEDAYSAFQARRTRGAADKPCSANGRAAPVRYGPGDGTTASWGGSRS